MILEVAVADSCDGIVTHNVRDFAGVETFGIDVWTPKNFLELIRAQQRARCHSGYRIRCATESGSSRKLNQFIATAAAAKMAALMTDEYLAGRGQRASRSKFQNALSRIPSRPADAEDGITADSAPVIRRTLCAL